MKTMMKICLMIIVAVLLAIFLFQNAGAETYNGVNIYRAAPESAFIGQKIWVALVFENTASESRNIAVNESLTSEADFNQSEAKYIQTEYGEKLWRYEWQISLAAHDNTSVAYWLVPKAAGTYVISPARIAINGQGYMLKSHAIEVRCNANEACESGENYLNCPEDCQSGGADGICDSASDGKCDPDCEQGMDRDCIKTKETKTTVNETGKETVKIGQGIPATTIAAIVVVILVLGAVAYLKFLRKGK